MNGADYIPAALRTECLYEPVLDRLLDSPNLLWHLQHTLIAGIQAGDRQSRLKRQLIYGDLRYQVVNSIPSWSRATPEMIEAMKKIQNDPRLLRLIHSLLGQMDEVAEKQQVLMAVLFKNGQVDPVNGLEESGDLSWYQAIENDVYGFTFEDCWKTNIAKLRARFPNKFSEEDALNRNIPAEQKLLHEKAEALLAPLPVNPETVIFEDVTLPVDASFPEDSPALANTKHLVEDTDHSEFGSADQEGNSRPPWEEPAGSQSPEAQQ